MQLSEKVFRTQIRSELICLESFPRHVPKFVVLGQLQTLPSYTINTFSLSSAHLLQVGSYSFFNIIKIVLLYNTTRHLIIETMVTVNTLLNIIILSHLDSFNIMLYKQASHTFYVPTPIVNNSEVINMTDTSWSVIDQCCLLKPQQAFMKGFFFI